MRYFNRSDFDCQETGNNEMSDEFLWAIDALRHECGFPSSLQVVTAIQPIALRPGRPSLEPMPRVSQQTSESQMATKPTRSSRQRSQWDLMV